MSVMPGLQGRLWLMRTPRPETASGQAENAQWPPDLRNNGKHAKRECFTGGI
jgi:hypothetical protein